MQFESTGHKGDIIVRGGEIQKLNEIYRPDLTDSTFVEHAVAPHMEGVINFIDWKLFFCFRDDINEVYYSCDQLPIRGYEEWHKKINYRNAIRFLVWKLLNYHNISKSSVPKTQSMKPKRTQSAQQDTIDLYNNAIKARCESRNLKIIEREEKEKPDGYISIRTKIAESKDDIFNMQSFYITIGKQGRIIFFSEYHALATYNKDLSGTEAKKHLRMIVNYG